MQFDKLRLRKKGISPDHDEMLAHVEAEAWTRFMAANITLAVGENKAAEFADRALAEFRKRFMDPDSAAPTSNGDK